MFKSYNQFHVGYNDQLACRKQKMQGQAQVYRPACDSKCMHHNFEQI